MATFGLVHGGFHGAWCWERLTPALAAYGHDAVTMDMPVDDPDATLSDYVDSVVDALVDVDEPVILVGHSMGGLVIPHVARRRTTERMVFIAAMFDNLPGPDPDGALAPAAGSGTDRTMITFDGRVSTISPEAAAELFFGECDPADAEWATSRLRPQGRAPATPFVEPWPDVPSSVILCTGDRARTAEYSRAVARQLGVTAIEMPGDHSPFLGRPADLAQILSDLAVLPTA